MKLFCVLLVSLAILCPLRVDARLTIVVPTLESIEELRQRGDLLETCAEALRDDLNELAQEFGGWVLDVFNRLGRIIDIRRTCNDLPLSDPPTRWELIQKELCELQFQAAMAAETVRLTAEITNKILTYPVIVRQSIERFMECTAEPTPESEEVDRLISSMLRN